MYTNNTITAILIEEKVHLVKRVFYVHTTYNNFRTALIFQLHTKSSQGNVTEV